MALKINGTYVPPWRYPPTVRFEAIATAISALIPKLFEDYTVSWPSDAGRVRVQILGLDEEISEGSHNITFEVEEDGGES